MALVRAKATPNFAPAAASTIEAHQRMTFELKCVIMFPKMKLVLLLPIEKVIEKDFINIDYCRLDLSFFRANEIESFVCPVWCLNIQYLEFAAFRLTLKFAL